MRFPGNWSQEAADNLRRLARIAVRHAARRPGQWINPTPLHTEVRYNAEVGRFEFAASWKTGSQAQAHYALALESDAIDSLWREWGLEISSLGDRAAAIVDLLTGPLGALADSLDGSE
jgi:hypothetical protein